MILDMDSVIKTLKDCADAEVLPKTLIMNERDLLDTMNRTNLTLVKEVDLNFNRILSTLMMMKRVMTNSSNIIIKSSKVMGSELYTDILSGWFYYVNYNKQMIFQYHLGDSGESCIGYPLQRSDYIALYEIEY